MSWTVPLTDLVLSDEDVEAYVGALRTGWLVRGPEVGRVEAEIAERCGVRHAVAVGGGSLALDLAIRALGLGPGDEVLVPAWCFVAAAHAVRHAGAEVVLVDGAADDAPEITPDGVRAACTPRTRAVLAVHMLGYAADVPGLRAVCDELGLALVEDCAQAIEARDADGAVVGTTGDAGCLSFFSKKQLACGEGGMVLTQRDDVAERVRALRSHAITTPATDRHRWHADAYDVDDVGVDARLDEPRAALLRSRLRRLDRDLASRRAMARTYRRLLDGVPDVELPWSDEEVERATHFGFAVLVPQDRRATIKAAMTEVGVQTTCYPALTMTSAYADVAVTPHAEAFSRRHLVLPMAAGFGEAEADTVVAALHGALGA